MLRAPLLVAAALLLAGCAGPPKSSESSGKRTASGAGDKGSLQGTWEQRPEEGPAATPRQRVVKHVRGDTETVTTYGPNDQVIHAQSARFRLSQRGGVPVYTFYDRRITAGAEQGKADASPRSFIYRLRGDEFDEVWGLLPGQEQRELVVHRWRRAGAPGPTNR
jgi:hypothetical protein